VDGMVKVEGKLKRAYKLYKEIRNWYLGLSEEEKETYRKYNPMLISVIEFLIELVEGGDS